MSKSYHRRPSEGTFSTYCCPVPDGFSSAYDIRVRFAETDEPVPVELDGEQPGTTPARFEVLPRALQLRVPAALPS